MNGYGPLQPMPYAAMIRRLEFWNIHDAGESPFSWGTVHHLLMLTHKMGLGANLYLNVPYDGDGAIVNEVELDRILKYFTIDPEDFMREVSDDEEPPTQ